MAAIDAGPTPVTDSSKVVRMVQLITNRPWRYSLWVPVLIGTGIAVYFSLLAEPAVWIGWAAGVFSVSGLLVSGIFQRTSFQRLMQTAALIAFGFAIAMLRTHSAGTPLIGESVRGATIRGIVAEVILSRDKPPKIVLKDVRIWHWSEVPEPKRLRLIAHKATADWIGRRIRAKADLWPSPPPIMPGAYDFGQRMFFEGVGGFGVVKSADLSSNPKEDNFFIWLGRVRLDLSRFIQNRIPGQHGAVAAALITGDRSGITKDTAEDLRRSGLAHLLAISGLHMGLVVGGVLVSVRIVLIFLPAIGLRIQAKKWAAAAAFAAAVLYLGLSGTSIPTIRAFVMASVIILAVLLDRRALSLRTICLAATVVLVLQPEALFGPGFQMSFAAAGALVWSFELWTARARDHTTGPRGLFRRILGGLAVIAATSLIAAIATAPFALYHFNRVAVFGLAANLVAMPMMALVIMPAGIAAMLAAPFGLADFPLWVMGQGISRVLDIAGAVAGMDGAVVWQPVAHTAALPMIVAGGLILMLGGGVVRLLAIPALVAGSMMWSWQTLPDVLVDERGKRILFHDTQGNVRIFGGRKGKFVTERWLMAFGLDPGMPAAMWRAHPDCDPDGCILKLADGGILAMPKTMAGAQLDCQRASIVVLRAVAKPAGCTGLAIDARDLKRGGAHAIDLSGDRPAVVTVNDVRGDRPWLSKGL